MKLRVTLIIMAGIAAALLMGCGGDRDGQVEVPGYPDAVKSSAGVRAERRAYDGAPPVIPHDDFGMDCVDCHSDQGMPVDEVGFAPPSPHGDTAGLSAQSRCRQCHVFRQSEDLFVASGFAGMRQDLRSGARFSLGSPPVIPHQTFMREDCAACHAGPAAREEIRTSHPERARCRQCHVARTATATFTR